ncbi:hypothetical protein G6F59_014390 [Rhizopus arrhizus]|nr:hypothetical protein G6F59_014390 [Rhizopus arrhizus]
MAKLTLASVDALRTRFADDAACDAALTAFADAAAVRAPLRDLVEAQHRYLQAEFEVAQVADVLRRDRKYAPVGRPSINIVQLRKQQAATKQAALIARQVVAQAAQTFVRVSGLAQRHALRDGIADLQIGVTGLQRQHRQRQVTGYAGDRAQRRAVLLHAITGLRRRRGMQQLHRALGLAEEVGAGDDLLARVAALLHAVAVQAIQPQP